MAYRKDAGYILFAALGSRWCEIKHAVREGIMHITENRNGAYVFYSEEGDAAEIERVRESARYEAELGYVLRRAGEDIDEGRYTADLSEFRRSLAVERNSRA